MSRLLLTGLAGALVLALVAFVGQGTAAPVPWVADGNTHIGDPDDPLELGSYSVAGNVHTVTGGGGDWWDWGERAHIAYKNMPAGEWRLETAISPVPIPPVAPGDHDFWVKAGLFIRNDADVGTLGDEREVNAFMAALRSDRNESAFQWRPDANNNWMGNTQYGGPNAPVALAIQRRLLGGVFPIVEGFVDFGSGWEAVGGTMMLNLADEPVAGLAVTAHRNQAGHTLTVDFTDPVITDPVLPPPPPDQRALGFTPPQGGMDTWGIREVHGAGDVGNLETVVQRLNEDADGTNPGTRVDYQAPVVNIWDSAGRGHFLFDSPYGVVTEGHVGAGGVDNISLVMSGQIVVPESGWYTFNCNSDDGFELAVDGKVVMEANYGKGTSDVLGYVELDAGVHPIRVLNWEGGGGAAVEVSAAPGLHASADGDFRMIGYKSVGQIPIPGLADEVMMTASPPDGWSGEPVHPGDPSIGGLNDATLALVECMTAVPPTCSTGMYAAVNHNDPGFGGPGMLGGDVPFPNDQPDVDDDNFGVLVSGVLEIPMDGTYHIGFNSDDGAKLQIVGHAWNSIVANDTGSAVIDGEWLVTDVPTGWSMTAGEIDLPAGQHEFNLMYFEIGGGAFLEMFGRSALAAGLPDAPWHLLTVGGADIMVDHDGLQLIPEPATWLMLVSGVLAMGLMWFRRRRA